jgi:hypothetical protein
MDGAGILRSVVIGLEARIAHAGADEQPSLRRALLLARDAAQDPMLSATQRRACRAALARVERPEGAVADLALAIRALAAGRVEDAARISLGDLRSGPWMPMGVTRCA